MKRNRERGPRLIDELEASAAMVPTSASRQDCFHVARAYRRLGMHEVSEELVRGLRPWAADCALGLDTKRRINVRH